MKVKTISVTYGRKINLGNYNSCEIGLQLWADLDETEDADQAVMALQGKARELAKAEYRRITGKVKDPANGRIEE